MAGSGHLGLKFGRDGLFPGGAAHVMVQRHAEDEDGSILVSPECVSYVELEAYVNLLRKDLDGLLASAKRKFQSAASLPPPPLFPK